MDLESHNFLGHETEPLETKEKQHQQPHEQILENEWKDPEWCKLTAQMITKENVVAKVYASNFRKGHLHPGNGSFFGDFWNHSCLQETYINLQYYSSFLVPSINGNLTWSPQKTQVPTTSSASELDCCTWRLLDNCYLMNFRKHQRFDLASKAWVA